MSAPQRATDREPRPARERWSALAPSGSLPAAVVLIGVAALLLHELHTLLLPFVVAGVTAYVCAPLVERLKSRMHIARWLAALTVLAGLMAAAALIGWLAVPALLRQAQAVTGDLQGSVRNFLQALLGTHPIQLLGPGVDAQRLADLTVGEVQRAMTGTQLLSLAAWGAAAAFGFMLVWVLMGYFLIDSPAIAAGLLWLVPPRARPQVERIWRELDPLLRRYFVGVVLVVSYAATTAYLGLGLVLGLHHALVLALLTGVLEIVPMVGPLAAAVIAGLVAVQQAASPWNIWAYVGYAVALRLSIDQLVGPLVLGKAARVHPVVVIFGFLVGGALFGIAGMILAVPFALLIKVTLSVLYREAA